ncbi:hypothetical protein ACFSKU_15815 [Pontibacter silvestris]|uniref:Uncharacterized protein n=1 Tax=Pontibacter silvestris TaxID=2305183 RepID=A0ABW4X1A4_9BACT|nr:hypothetical protein [Pontibacter silvestris]MCC9135936.1 hypothetical protein [Pontibacter silvestris]
MDLHQFIYKPFDQRAADVLKYGTFLAARIERGYHVLLYDMRDFYAEAWYDPTKSKITVVVGFASVLCLEPFLEAIELPGVI